MLSFLVAGPVPYFLGGSKSISWRRTRCSQSSSLGNSERGEGRREGQSLGGLSSLSELAWQPPTHPNLPGLTAWR
jgi:hypothetical protein